MSVGEMEGHEDDSVKMNCENASSLVPSYLDGELTEEQAAPLRGHLFDCPACREQAQDGKALTRWFVVDEAPAVPAGFAARVARRAFAGDPGWTSVPPQPARERPILRFVLSVSAVAAAVLFVFSIAIQNRSLPTGDNLRADGPPPWDVETAESSDELGRPATDDEVSAEGVERENR